MTDANMAAAVSDEPRERIIVALDVETVEKAHSIVSELSGLVGAFKVGLQLFTVAGPSFVRELTSAGQRVFLDLKFHDIPNTVAKAGIEAARLGVWMFNVHALGGSEMMRRVAAEVDAFCETESFIRPRIIAVTMLTSSSDDELRQIGIERNVGEMVVGLAHLAAASGLDGVVTSAHEADIIRNSIASKDFLIVTPGIRPLDASNDDQKRVMTPGRAIATGADYIVVGRPVTEATDMRAAVGMIAADMVETN